MELNDRIYELSVQANLDGQDIKVLNKGEDTGAKAKHIFKNIKFETGKIRAFGITEFYSVKDGFLCDKEGNQISFATERFPEIKINRIKIPFLAYDEIDVTREWVSDICKLLNLEKPEEQIKDMTDEDKQAFVKERELYYAELEKKKADEEAEAARIKAEEDEKAAAQARKDEEEAKTQAEIKAAEEATRLAEEEAKKSEEARIQAEEEAKAKAKAEEEAKAKAEEAEKEAKKAEEEARKKKEEEEKEYVISAKQFEKISRRDKKKGFVEYTKDPYHFFYASESVLPKGELPYILKKRADGKYEELEGAVVDENEEEVEFEFTDDGDKTLILDIENEDITIE